jgi:hypothetical protein
MSGDAPAVPSATHRRDGKILGELAGFFVRRVCAHWGEVRRKCAPREFVSFEAAGGLQRGVASPLNLSFPSTHSRSWPAFSPYPFSLLTIASLDDPTPFPPEMSIWTEDRLPWVIMDESRPTYRRSSWDG